jgi:iron(III) transport system ATP-binding protein
LLQIASPDQIYNRPADLFVASFTGASNLVGGRVLGRNGEFGTVEAECGQQLAAWLSTGVETGARVKIAVRPENVRLNSDGAANRFTARITGQRFQGTHTIYELAVLGGRMEAIELGTGTSHAVGSEIDLVLPPELCWAYPLNARSSEIPTTA